MSEDNAMAVSTKSTSKRNWKTPSSRATWLWFAFAILLYGGIYAWYLFALKHQQYVGPDTDPLRIFGIVAYVLVLLVTAYTLRRRFVRTLPGKVQNWLWLHTWLGIASILIALLHENYANVLHDYDFSFAAFSDANYGMSALFLLIALVISGVLGRLLDTWQAHVISQEANRNGIGISRSVKDHLLELELGIERVVAGKSASFKQYNATLLKKPRAQMSNQTAVPPHEQKDLQHLHALHLAHQRLRSSLYRQKRAETIIAAWRYIHIPLACLAIAVISYHALSELYMIFFPG
jgi:hypothetical protein